MKIKWLLAVVFIGLSANVALANCKAFYMGKYKNDARGRAEYLKDTLPSVGQTFTKEEQGAMQAMAMCYDRELVFDRMTGKLTKVDKRMLTRSR